MVCKLCLKSSDLKKSHIIPEAFFKSVYDKKHRMFPITMDNKNLKLVQKGYTEKLLCGNCEQKFSKWETVLKKSLIAIGEKQSNSLKFTFFQKYEDLFVVDNVKYKEFKLGVLSILWRMSIASDKFYKSYSLGDYYEEKLRKILLKEEFVDETKYPVNVMRYELDGIFYPGIIMTFAPDKIEHFTVHNLVIWGHHFRIFVNDKTFPKLPIALFLRNSGQLIVAVDSLANRASPNNVFSKIYDLEIINMYAKLKYK